MKIKAGDLDKRVILQRSVESADSSGFGEPIPAWYDEARLWAAIASTGSRELYFASQTYPTVTHVLTIRYREGLTPKKRIKWGSRILNIEGFSESDNRLEGLTLYCKEANPDT